MLTRAGLVLLFAGLSVFSAGLASGNPYYVTMSLVPLCVFLAALATEAPGGVRAALRVSPATARPGEEVLVEVEYEVRSGLGAVEFQVALPETLALATGRNVHLAAKRGFRPVTGRFAFTLRAEHRGAYDVGPVKAESIHAAGVRAPATGEACAATRLEVKPPHAPLRRVRGMTGLARQAFPESDSASRGIRTTEFRELRGYHPGDPVRAINWRATARQPGFHHGAQSPLVNDHEHEGKKSVWLFLDAAPYMRMGTTLENSFEHAIAAANGLAQFYLDRGYKVGGYVYNHDRSVLLHPEVGHSQLLRLSRAFTQLAPGPDDAEGLHHAVERARRHLLQEKPLVIVVTRAGKADERFFHGLRRLRGMTGRRRRRLPILVVSPIVQAAIPSDPDYGRDLVALVRRRERPLVQRIRRTGAQVVEWDPTRGRFEATLLATLRGGRAR